MHIGAYSSLYGTINVHFTTAQNALSNDAIDMR
jgi:hypothetical protein